MKKNIYLIIITIITVVCIIAGSLYHIGGFALDLFDNLIPRSDKSLGNVCTEELSVDEFSNLVFDTTISNINVKTGDSYMVSYKCNKRLVPKIKSSGDTLTISQSNRANYKRNTTSEITVTIPEGAALNKKDTSGKLICCGMGALIGFQAFINLCVATGLMPNTGMTLPFVSYGLTSLVSLYMGMGIVLNVGLQPKKYS